MQRLHDLAHQNVCALIEGKPTKQNHPPSPNSLVKHNLELSDCVKNEETSLVDLNKIEAYSTEELW